MTNLPKTWSRSRFTVFSFLASAFMVLLLSVMWIPLMPHWFYAEAQPYEPLADRFAPVLHFTRDEKFYPTSVEYIISSSELKRRLPDGSSVLVDSTPTPQSLGTYASSDMFLDNKFGTFDAIASDYASKVNTLGYFAYVHVEDNGVSIVIQYWLFYVYNNGPLNNHQGDIEVIEVFLDSSENPQTLLLSQHFAGQNAAWGDVEKQASHPVVYVAQGSHANYFRSYQGKMGIENDIVGSEGITITPSDLRLVMLGEKESHPASQGWLDFPGRWGRVGTEQEIAAGMAGPFGPVFNHDGVRWAEPTRYLSSTFSVGNTYFLLAWIVANFLLLFLIYIAIRSGWKIWGIVKLRRKGGLLVRRFVRGRGGMGLILGICAILITIVALALPWYSITAASETGPLAQEGGVTLMTVDGISGLKVNTFLVGSSESPSGYGNLFSMQVPFAILIGAGLILLALDIVGVKSGKSMGMKFIIGAIISLLPFILILIFITQLPSFLPWASSLLPGQQVPDQVQTMVSTVAATPVFGTASKSLPVVGTTTVNWGFGLGAYLFFVAAGLRVAAGFIMRSQPDLQERPVQPPPAETPPPPPPTISLTRTNPCPIEGSICPNLNLLPGFDVHRGSHNVLCPFHSNISLTLH